MKGFKYTATPVTRTNLLAYKVLEEMWSSFHGFVSCFTDIHGLLIQLWAVTDLISCHCILDFFSFLRITHIETYLACCLFKSLHFFFLKNTKGNLVLISLIVHCHISLTTDCAYLSYLFHCTFLRRKICCCVSYDWQLGSSNWLSGCYILIILILGLSIEDVISCILCFLYPRYINML